MTKDYNLLLTGLKNRCYSVYLHSSDYTLYYSDIFQEANACFIKTLLFSINSFPLH